MKIKNLNKLKNKTPLLIFFTILSVLLFIFGLFHIPILSLMGVNFPERNILWGLSIIPTVIVSAIPLIACINCWTKQRGNKNDKDRKNTKT